MKYVGSNNKILTEVVNHSMAEEVSALYFLLKETTVLPPALAVSHKMDILVRYLGYPLHVMALLVKKYSKAADDLSG